MRGMTYALHAIVIAAYFLGSDFIANDGAETANFLRSLQPQAILNEAKTQHHHVVAQVEQEMQSYRPYLAMLK
jgi:hypothetical protein